MKIRKHVWIKGEVKNTFFRMGIKSNAKLLAVNGWVRKVYDGLECMFEGEKEYVLDLIEYCRQSDNGAAVKEVVTEETKYRGEFSNFEIRER